MSKPIKNAAGAPEEVPGQITDEGPEGMDNAALAAEEPAEGPEIRGEECVSPAEAGEAGACPSAEERVCRMEELFVRLSAAAADGRTASDSEDDLREAARVLSEYLSGGGWLQDYERDEQGLFPAGLKRGVLSQDGLYDLLEDPAVRALLIE